VKRMSTETRLQSGLRRGKLLDFISNERVFTAERIARALGLKKARHLNDLKFLVSNMHILAHKWRDSIDAHGALTFYIDAY